MGPPGITITGSVLAVLDAPQESGGLPKQKKLCARPLNSFSFGAMFVTIVHLQLQPEDRVPADCPAVQAQ